LRLQVLFQIGVCMHQRVDVLCREHARIDVSRSAKQIVASLHASVRVVGPQRCLKPSVAKSQGCISQSDNMRAAGYANAVPSGDNLYWSGMWELKVDRNRRVGCKRHGQWIQPAPSVERTALWIRVANFQDISDGESLQAVWEPLFEIPSHGAPF
jgi:hypothetical protein